MPASTAEASKKTKASDSKKSDSKKKYSASGKTVHVKRGYTLSKIAKLYDVEGGWKGLLKLNKKTIKDPNLIYIGQVIKIK